MHIRNGDDIVVVAVKPKLRMNFFDKKLYKIQENSKSGIQYGFCMHKCSASGHFDPPSCRNSVKKGFD